MSANPDQGGGLMFACPHCGGPLHRVDSSVECEAGHKLSVVQVGLEQARKSARAAWEAVRALEERANWARWVSSDPTCMGSPATRRRSKTQRSGTMRWQDSFAATRRHSIRPWLSPSWGSHPEWRLLMPQRVEVPILPR